MDPLRRREDREELQELARDVARRRDLFPSLDRIADLALVGAGAVATYLEMVDFEADEVEIVATAGDAAPAVGARVPYPGSLAKQVLERADIELLSAAELALRPIGRIIGQGRCARCTAVVAPLISEGEPLGALILLREPRSDALLRAEADRFRVLADLAALALGRRYHAHTSARVSEQLARSEHAFHLFVDAVQEYAMVLLDTEGRVASWNRGAERIKGWSANEILGKPFSTFYPPEDRASGRPEMMLERARQRGQAQDEGWRVRRDGSRFWADVTITAIRDEAGELWGFGKVTRDLTRHRDAEESLRASQRNLRFLLRASARLAASLDYRETLATLAEVAVEQLADWCVADVIEDGEVRRLAVAHADPAMAGFTEEYLRRFPPEPDPSYGLGLALETGEAQLYPDVDQRDLERPARTPEQRELLASVGIRSLMIAPMLARGRTVGALTFVSTRPDRRYDERDLELARELASRGATAVDNARLFAEAEQRAAENRRLTAHLADALTELEGVLAVVPVGIGIATDRECREIRVNPAFAEQLGIPEGSNASLSGEPGRKLPFRVFRDGREVPPEELPIQRAARLGVEVSGEEYDIVHEDGRVVRLLEYAAPLMGPDGEPRGAVGAFVDISSRREADLERDRLLASERAARKEAEAATAEAERAREAAEMANRAKSDFLAVMSHELRTPLNAIGGYVELMEMGIRGPVTPQQREDLARVQRNQKHLLGLINQVLNYARIERGNVHYDIVPVPVAEVLGGLDPLITPQLQSRGITFRIESCRQGLSVLADHEKLSQILMNLLSNAGKFNAAGGEVVVECEEKGSDVLIRVRDTGAGIPESKIAEIFEPFVQIDPNLTRTEEGVGLGLAISRDLARGMGGDLTVESRVGEGSTFTLRLPQAW